LIASIKISVILRACGAKLVEYCGGEKNICKKFKNRKFGREKRQ